MLTLTQLSQNRVKLQVGNKPVVIKKAHWSVGEPNRIEFQISTEHKLRFAINGVLRAEVDFKWNKTWVDLLRSRLEFGGGFQGIFSDVFVGLNSDIPKYQVKFPKSLSQLTDY